ncbi:MAG: serine hydrolase domain-containing protein [Halothermotrichaceae bacterium]
MKKLIYNEVVRIKKLRKLILLACIIVLIIITYNNFRDYLAQRKDRKQLAQIVITDNDSLADRLQKTLDKKVIELDAPGIQAAVRIDDFSWDSASGSIDLADEEKLTTEHILRIGSVTKTFTAAVIMKLYQQGKLNLGDKIKKWFPDFPQADNITVRHLLSHSSGIYNYTGNLSVGFKSVFTDKKWDPYQLIEIAADEELNFTPGTKHLYSNTNFIMLGLIIEKITEKTITEIFRDYIFEPARLENTYFVPYEKIPENLINGYDFDVIPVGNYTFTPEENSLATMGYSAGAIVSTASDLRQWIDYLFKSNFLKKETLSLMKKYIKAQDKDVKKQIGYGLGLRVLKIKGDELYGHTGTIPGFGGAVFYCPQKDYSIAVLSNHSIFEQIDVLQEMIKIINKSNSKQQG